MGHRHLPNTSQMSEIDQDQNQCHGAVEGSYLTIGRAVAPDNGSYAYPTEHRVTNRGYDGSQQDFEGRLVDHSSSGFRLGGHYMQPAVSGTSYDSFPGFPTARSINMVSENNAGHAHPNFPNWHTTNEIEGGSLAPTMGIVRGPFKRKSPDISVACERGDTSRFFAGSSSNSEFQLEKSTVDHQNYSSSSNGLPHYWSGSRSVGSEDFQRNVRSRSGLDLEPNTWRNYSSTYSSNHHCSMTHPMNHQRTAEITNLNGNSIVPEPTHNTVFPAAHGRLPTTEYSGMNHETNQFFVGGNSTEIGGHCHGPILSRNPVLPPQYPQAPHPQAVMGSRINYSRGAIPPSYTSDPSFSRLGSEASSSANHLQFPSGSYSSQHSRPLPARGWHSNYRDGRSRRFHRPSNAVEGHDRMRSEAFAMMDRSSLYGSRNMFDQYRDMRLDVDNMSYEELLALGERIGSVNTGLSKEVVPKCLMVKTYCSSDCNQEEASCAICLEKYENGEEIGTVRKCGHDYHVGCVKRWLSMKNVCPICKGPAQADGGSEEK